MSIAIGPVFEVGGNSAQMTNKGKIQVTNPQGKVVTLSQDEFKKQLIKNADKLNSGENIEFKKDNKGLKIAAAVAGTAAITTGIIYRKEIGKFVKDFSFKKVEENIKSFGKKVKKFGTKLKNKIVNLFKKRTKTRTVFDGEKAHQVGEEGAKVARETLALKNKSNAHMANEQVAYVDGLKKLEKGADHNDKQELYERLFTGIK